MADLSQAWDSAKPVDLSSAWDSARPATKKELNAWDLLAPLDVAAHLASSAIVTPLAGVAGLAAAAMPGKTGQGAKTVQSLQSALTYEPRTLAGEAASNVIAMPFELLHKGAVKGGQVAQDLGAPPLLSTAIQTGIEALPLAIGKLKPTEKTLNAKQLNEVRDATYKAAREEGYVYPPSATGAGVANQALESSGARTLLNQEAILRNQQTTNKIAAREVGLPENTPITPARLEARRYELAEPYREASQIDPAVAADVKAMREARQDANRWFKFYEHTPNPRFQDRAQRLMDKANQLETYIDQAAQQAGKLDLLERLRDARKEIAKTYDVERALNLGTGDVSARILGSLLDKGEPLSGGLETIAKAQQAFGPYMRDAAALANPGVGNSHGMLGMGAGASGLHGGLGWWTSGVPFLSGAARSTVLSNPYQNAVGTPYYGGVATPRNSLAALLESLQAQQENK